MDRVLLVIEDIQYATHLEMTLRKVGFDIETISNEYNLPDKLLTFNPDYVIVKGIGQRVSAINSGRKLKDTTKFLGKVVLIFPENLKTSPDDLIKLRMDLLLFEPITAIRLVTHLLNLTQLDKDSILDKLLRLAHTDMQFRTFEAQILKNSGSTIDSEIQIISGRKVNSEENIEINEDDIMNFIDPDAKPVKKAETSSVGLVTSPDDAELERLNPKDFALSDEYRQKLKTELATMNQELPLRIESYNRVIKTIDQDLKSGHKKRQTRSTNQNLFKSISDESNQKQDAERKRFAKALAKK